MIIESVAYWYILINTVVYTSAVILWFINSYIFESLKKDFKDKKYGADDVQVRILTVDNDKIVKKTVEQALKMFDDVVVISEVEMDDIPTSVYKVPDDFETKAIRKGRALEWARKNIDHDKEYNLYIDEDTLIKEFDGFVDCDIIQFKENPIKTTSWITYLTEVFRVGYQTEQRGFGYLAIPSYVWGGGLAIRKELEDRITWDFESITEDTIFAWKAGNLKIKEGTKLTFSISDQRFYNQAPANVRSMFNQRRRWISGTVNQLNVLPFRYRVYTIIRLVIWCLSPLLLLNGLVIYMYPSIITTPVIIMFAAQFVFIHLFTLIGVKQYWSYDKRVILAVPLSIPLSIINAIGAIWGVIKPTKTFIITDKV